MNAQPPIINNVSRKIIVLGEGTGRSSFITRICKNYYDNRDKSNYFKISYPQKIDFNKRTLVNENRHISYMFWRIPYNNSQGIHPMFMRSTDVCIFTFSFNDYKSFENILPDIDQVTRNSNNNIPVMMLIGLKCDLKEERQVSTEEAKSFATALGLKFLEVSAKDDIGIKETFDYINEKCECVRKMRDLLEIKNKQKVIPEKNLIKY